MIPAETSNSWRLSMPFTGTSIASAGRPARPLAALAIAGFVLGLGSLAGCSQAGIPVGSAEVASAPSPTQHRATTEAAATAAALVEADAIDPADLKTVLSTAAAALNTGRTDQALAWSNADTGSTGAVTPLDIVADGDRSNCKVFASTVNDVRGVRRYRGEACMRGDGTWNLTRFVPEDEELS